MIKMVAADLDNTLLRSDKTISEYTLSVLRKCRSNGVKIAFATARSTQATSRFLDMFELDVFIGYGALVSAGREVIRRFDIPAKTSSQIIRECLAAPEVSFIFAINESAAFTNDREYMKSIDASHYKYADFLSDYKYSYLKISITSANQTAVERIAANYPICDMLRYTGEDLYRFANRGAVKWNAVKAAAEHYDISADEVASFGDDVNDLEMLAKCGIGVAVENAVDEAKAAAGYICGSNDGDGVAKWIEEYIL